MQRQGGLTPRNFYSQWRTDPRDDTVREQLPSPPPEELLQTIWQHQRLRREALQTTDSRPVRVLHPGFWNHEAGPDFRRAVIRVDGAPSVSGDVEVDPRASDWRAHGHATNPAFRDVILHVVWNGPSRTMLPTIRLQPHLDAPLAELADWQTTAFSLPAEYTGQCRAPLAALSSAEQDELLTQAAGVRLHEKSTAFARYARAHGWEAALWRGLFRALGYKHNVWPMQNLAELLPVLQSTGPTDALGWQARLLGTAGLLTDNLPAQTPTARQHLRGLWDHWWRERDALEEFILPVTLWHFAGLRPANHPIRRLVLLAHWLAAGNLAERLEDWLQLDYPKTKLAAGLSEAFAVVSEDFWRWHWTFRSARQTKPCTLLGASRVTDIAVNVILPWFHARAAVGRNGKLLQRIENRYHFWPTAQDNAILKLARQRLFGGPRRLSRAAAQQGLLQIVRDYCDHAPATCKACRFPDFVQSWPDQSQ